MKCALCNEPTAGKSKYCYEHRKEARARFKKMLTEQSIEREQKYAEFNTALAQAWEEGLAAGEAAIPTPMVVQQRASPLDDNSQVVKEWHVPDGVCGFAWVNVSPGTSSFAKWLIKNDHAHKAYKGGVTINIHAFNQSMTRKEACAHKMAEVLNDMLANQKLSIYAGSRMD
jgi:hypothetical protein